MVYKVPKINEKSFTCPHCGVLAGQSWCTATLYLNGYIQEGETTGNVFGHIRTSTCVNCNGKHIWLDEKMFYPTISNVPLPNQYMPENVKSIYEEARSVFPKSAKASAALLRLALQHLCKELDCKGKDINEDIKELVKGGLPSQVQKALDIIRVTGNNAVHPGKMDLDDNEQVAAKLFELLNFIVDKMIVQPMEIDSIFEGLPEGALKAIERRDKANA